MAANAYEVLELDAGSGGGKIAGDEFTQSATTKFMPSSTLSVPDGSGDFERVGDAGVSLPVSVEASALPSGAATGAKQDTGNASLSSIDGKITAVNTGAVVVASSALPSGAATAAKQPALGVAGTPSTDVVTVQGHGSMTPLKTDGSATTQPVSAASLPLPTGAATEAKQDAQSTLVGAVNESAPGSDTASSGLNGRLQRIAQRITSLIALIPSSLSNGFFQVSLKETIAVPVTDNAGSLTVDAPVGTPVFVRLSDGSTAIATLPVSLASVPSHAVTNAGVFATQPTIQAGTALIGLVAAGADASNRYNGSTALTPKFANIDVASSGDNQIVAAVSGKTLRVISVFLAASGAVDAVFNDGTGNILGGTRKVKLDNTGAVGAGGFCLQENRTGWFQTGGTNRPINLNLSGAVGVAGVLTYVEV